MKYNENLILSPNLLNSQENLRLNNLLVLLQKFIREVPVAHYDHSDKSQSPIFNGNEVFFRDDYSYLLENSSHTGVELVKMIRIFVNFVNRRHKPETTEKEGDLKQVEIWDLIIEKIPDGDNDTDKKAYIGNVKEHLNDLDSVTMPLSLLLQGRSLYDKTTFWKAKDLYTNRFRTNDKNNDLNFLIPQDDKSLNLFFTVNGIRNKKEHWDVSRFNAPKDPEKAYEHYRNMHLRIVLCCMILFDRFYEELWEILVEDKDVIDISALGDKPAEESKKLLKKLYIERLRKTSEAQMRLLFRETGLSDKKDLLSDLPEMLLSTKDDTGNTIVGDCVEMLVDNQDRKRKIVSGNAGSGKTVMLLRMIQRNQPMLTPFYIELKDFNTADYTSRLERMVIREDLLIITKYTLNATLERIRKLLSTGSAVFFIDSAECAPENMTYLARFISQYPECHYIIATQQETMPDEIKCLDFQQYEVMPFNEAQTKDLMRLMSIHITGTDRTESLYRKIRQISQDIIRNPLTLAQLIYLYEKRARNMNRNLSRPMLFWNLYDSIQDEEDRIMLKSRQFMQQFFRNLEDVTELCRNVIAMYNADHGSDWPSPILNFALVSSDLKQFFDLTEVIGLYERSLERDAIVFRTLATMAILEKDLTHQEYAPHINTENDAVTIRTETLPRPNPALDTIAQAIRDLPFIEPDSGDVHNSGPVTGNSRITYRLQPKYIIRQYLLSLLFFYKKSEADIRNSPEQIETLFTCIASSGDEEVIKEIFAPYWIRQWLINKNDISETDNIKVYGGKNSPLRITLSQNNAAPHVFVLLLLRQSVWIEAKGMTHTGTLLEGTIHDVIVHHMNDDQREKFVNRLGELSGLLNEDRLGYFRNLAIASMDSIYLLDQYDRNNNAPLSDDVIDHLKDMGNYVPALSILTQCMAHLMLTDDSEEYKKNSNAIHDLLNHIVRNGILKTSGLREEFWTVIRTCQQHHRNIRNYLDKISIEDILRETTLKAYDKMVWEHLANIYRYEEKRLSEWVEPVDINTCKDLYLPVDKEGVPRKSVQYTFYSQPEETLYIVSAAWIDEMPEGKFCQIKNLDRWFFVEDVIVLGQESDLTHIAELTVNLPDGTPRRRKGRIVLGDGQKLNYIHLFEHGTSRQVVVRIDDKDASALLLEAQHTGSLRHDRQVLFNGIKAELAGLDIREVPKDMRLIVLKPVMNDGLEYSTRPEKIDGIPMEGRLSFYPKKDKSQLHDGLLLKMPPASCIAGKKVMNEIVYLGNVFGMHYILSDSALNVGNHLVWNRGNMIAEIAFSYPLDEKSGKGGMNIPSAILDFIDNMTKAGKQKYRNPVLYVSAMTIYQEGKGLYIQELHTPGSMMDEVSVRFYHPITVPQRKAWQHVEHKIEVDSVTGVLKEIEDLVLIGIPKTSYPPNAKFYSTPEYPTRMPVIWHTLHGEGQRYENMMFITVDPKAIPLFSKETNGQSLQRETSVQFFERADSGKALNIRFRSLSDMVDTAKHTRYHSSITPLLIKEWISEGTIDTFRYQFCKNKQYLAKLIQECIHHNIPIMPTWDIRLYYVADVKDNTTVALFAPPAEFKTWDGLNEGMKEVTGDLPKGLKTGNMVIQEKDRLTIIDDRSIRKLREHGQWGFIKGRMTTANHNGKKMMRIECVGKSVWFVPYGNFNKKDNNREVIFFPVIIDNIAMAKFIQFV